MTVRHVSAVRGDPYHGPVVEGNEVEGISSEARPSFSDRRSGRDGSDRPPRFDRRDDRGSRDRVSGPMETFRIEVGSAHGVKPGNIVGAITNEAGLTSSHIGRIEIFDDYCFVDMLVGMPQETFQTLQQVVIAGQPLNMSRAGGASPKRAFPKKHRPTTAKRPAHPTIAEKSAKPKKSKRFAANS